MHRILMVSSLWPPDMIGGAEAYAADLGAQLRERGHVVAAVTRGVRGDDVVAVAPAWPYRLDAWASQPRWRRAAFHALDLWNPAGATAVREAIARFRPTVVHSHSVTGMSVASLTAPRSRRIPHVHTLHDYWLLCQRSSLVKADGDPCETACTACSVASFGRKRAMGARGPQVVIAPSERIAREHRAIPGLADRLRVIRHPIVPVEPPVREPGVPTFGYLGQMTEVKGVRTLLRAFAQLPAGSARLRLAGRGPLEPAPGDAAPEGVEHVGWVSGPEKDRFLSSVDCLVVPSEWQEPAPLVINEAKARLLPVIGSRMGGIPELVPASCGALLFPAGDEHALAASMRRFVDDPSAFPVADAERSPSWGEHIEAVVCAYDDAARA